MKNTLVIGDIHGRDIWKQIINIEEDEVNDIVFLGDYFDSFGILPQTQLENFKDILAYRDSNPLCVTLMLGNHDWHYIRQSEHYSGRKQWTIDNASSLISECLEKGLLRYVHLDLNGVLYSHAGVSRHWLDKWAEGDINKVINFEIPQKALDFTFEGGGDVYGNTMYASPIWIRPGSLVYDMPEQFKTQVVGHTHHDNITVRSSSASPNINLVCADCLDNNEYLIINHETGELIPKRIEK